MEEQQKLWPRILLVDDDEIVRGTLKEVLELSEFCVTTAKNVSEAIHLIDTEAFDVLLSDLHMPGAGDGFTVISAMRHKHPNAVTLLFTGYPALKEAMDAILLQADEVLVKPMPIVEMVALIRERLERRRTRRTSYPERVATILEREATTTITEWLWRVNEDSELNFVALNDEERTGHLSQLIRELVHRLRVPRSLGTKQPSDGAVMHGRVRCSQGYSIPMIIEESRILQVSIFNTLQSNLKIVDFSLLLVDVMTIGDECDSQRETDNRELLRSIWKTGGIGHNTSKVGAARENGVCSFAYDGSWDRWPAPFPGQIGSCSF
jgi:DNA-binding response OmpR family regulator